MRRTLVLLALLGASFGRAVAAPAPKTLTVICYHRFGAEGTDPYKISVDRLNAQLDWLKSEGYQTVSLSQVAEAVEHGPAGLPDRALILSIDDGYKAGLLGAAPIEAHGFRAVYFVNPGSIGGGSFMDWQACRDLEKRGHEVASHTLTHGNLAKPLKGQSPAQYKAWVNREFGLARSQLERELKHPVTAMAYPFGAYNPAVGVAAAAAGYSLIFTVSDGVNLSASLDAPRLRRILLMGHPSQESFVRRLTKLPIEAPFNAMQEGALFYQGGPGVDLGGLDPALKLTVDDKPATQVPNGATLGFHFLGLAQGASQTKLLYQVAPQAWEPYFKALTEN